MTGQTYERIRVGVTLYVQCYCGKLLTRRRTFEQTVNPFNRTPDGTPKTRAQVEADVRDDAAAWTPTGGDALCATCRGVE